MNVASEEHKVRVAEAFLEDVGKGFARMDADDLIRLHAAPGDVLLITGRRPTVARAVQAPPSHCGQYLIMMDGTTRTNAQAGVDEYVSVKKVPFKAANSVLLSPVQAADVLVGDAVGLLRRHLGSPERDRSVVGDEDRPAWIRAIDRE